MRLMDREQSIRARSRPALRAEQAFGLRSIPLCEADQQVEAEQAHAGRCATEFGRGAAGVDTRLPVASVAVDLFGKPLVAQPMQIQIPTLDAFAQPVLARDEKIRQLNDLDSNHVARCTSCRLCEQRTHTVFGEGDPDAKIMFIGEGPGENEDRHGRPFVGRAGRTLDKMIAGMGLQREQVFIANIVKCRPPGNREPATDEVATCMPYLHKQIEIIRPKVIVTLGRPAAQYMLGIKVSISRLRGSWQTWRNQVDADFSPGLHLAQLHAGNTSRGVG